MGVTIKDVAKKCGLSITTVSLVLNNKDSRISEKTKQMITEVAQELNYVPNRMAVGLATKKTLTIGLIAAEAKSHYYSSLVQAAEAACRNAGFFLMLYNLSYQSEKTLQNTFQTVIQNVDGIIFDPSFCSVLHSQDLLKLLTNAKIPVITLSSISSQMVPGSIVIDRRQSAYIAAAHLLSLNHKKIGCLFPPPGLNISLPLLDGYRDAMEDSGLEPDEELIIEEDGSADAAARALNRFTAAGVTAIIVYSDTLTAGLYRAAHETGLCIPEELSLVSLEDSPFFTCFDVTISALSLHADRVARKAVNLIRKSTLDGSCCCSSPEMIQPFFFQRGSSSVLKVMGREALERKESWPETEAKEKRKS